MAVASIGLVDSWAVGQVPGAAQLAGLALGAYGLSSVGWALSFLRMGTTGLVAQARGAGQPRRLVRTVLRSALLGGLFGLLFWAMNSPATDAILWAVGAQGAERDIAASYIAIRLWAAPFILIKIAVVGIVIGLQRTDVALGLEVGVNALNAGLTSWFVLGLDMGAAGAAYGSLIAECIAGLAAIALAAKALRVKLLLKALKSPALWQLTAFLKILQVNGYLFARTLALIVGFGLFIASAQNLGTAALAACHILLNFYVLQALTLDGLAYAAEALVGDAIGARTRAKMRFWVIRTSLWAFGFGMLYLVGFSLAGEWLFEIFARDTAVRTAAQPLYLWIALTPPIAVACYQLDGVYIGASAARPMFITMLIALAVMQALIWAMLPDGGVSALCGAFLAFFAMRGLGLLAAYPALERQLFAPASK